MAEIKYYEIEPFQFDFTPDGDPLKGSLRTLYPELKPHLDQVNLASDRSRDKYAQGAADRAGISKEGLTEALEELANKRHEERSAAIEAREGPENGDSGGSISDTDILVWYAEAFELFHTPDGKAYGTFHNGDVEETWAVESKRFEQRLRQLFYEVERKAPGATALQNAIDTIAAKALFEGHEEQVFLRVAGHEGSVYVDLCNDRWDAVRVTADGWQIVEKPPVKFIRNNNSAPLPNPARGGDIGGLRSFLNLDTEDDFKLIVAWLIGTFKPYGPYPLLEITGEQGTAKSTTERMLRYLVDPARSPLRSLPTNERDLVIAARHNRILSYDNLSYIRPQVSDAMCRLSTGGGFGTRTLYTDDEETLFDDQRPQMVNGINQIVMRGDLQDRSLLVNLLPIPEDERREERKIWADFEEARPAILGALLDAVSCVLRNFESVQLDELPRMADFAVWVTAAEEALGWERGAFLSAYADNRKAVTETTLAEDPVASTVLKLLDLQKNNEWRGTSEKLLEKLCEEVSEEVKRSNAWPKAPNALSRRLKRLAPLLRQAGIEYEEYEEGHSKTKIKSLRRVRGGDEQIEGGNTDPPEGVTDDDIWGLG